MPNLKNIDMGATDWSATDYYPDDSEVPMQDIPDEWLNEVHTFFCWSNHTFDCKLERLIVNMDYFEPVAKCPICQEVCYIKKCY